MVNKWFAQCTWEKANTATTNKEAAEELTNCTQMQMLLTSGFRGPQKINWGPGLSPLWVCSEGIGGCDPISVGLKKYFNGNFPWRWESRIRSSMADTSAEHFFCFSSGSGSEGICSGNWVQKKQQVLSRSRKNFSHAQTKQSLHAQYNGTLCSLSLCGLEKVEMFQPLQCSLSNYTQLLESSPMASVKVMKTEKEQKSAQVEKCYSFSIQDPAAGRKREGERGRGRGKRDC